MLASLRDKPHHHGNRAALLSQTPLPPTLMSLPSFRFDSLKRAVGPSGRCMTNMALTILRAENGRLVRDGTSVPHPPIDHLAVFVDDHDVCVLTFGGELADLLEREPAALVVLCAGEDLLRRAWRREWALQQLWRLPPNPFLSELSSNPSPSFSLCTATRTSISDRKSYMTLLGL